TGCGTYLPDKVLTNKDMEQLVDTTDDWINKRSGIRARRMAAEGELTSDLAIAAGKVALDNAGVDAKDVDAVIVATTTPDRTFPATAVRVQDKMGIRPGGIAFDLQAVCTGFVYALAVADNFIRVGQCERVLIIGAETFSRIVDWKDRGTAVLFGDGAGALLLEAGEGNGTRHDRGVLSTHLHADGRYRRLLETDGGPSLTQTAGKARMDGREVFRHAVARLSDVVTEALATGGFAPEDVDLLVPHQANIRIIEGASKKLRIPMDRVVTTIHDHGNTSAASIPLALGRALSEKRIKKGDLLLLDAMGAGLTWGAAIIRW
ncbi:MAG: beta-ketoacyl-ACP synthase III, partial [Pseudomonadota bacterium]|nr:beta-ketoacyl-ACP synthase III [Pseudomonadota bacterium]